MRQIGHVADPQQASRLVDYLAAQGIRARADEQPSDAGVAVWSYDEDQRTRAQELLAEFQLNPADARYDEAAGKAREIAREEAARDKKARRNMIDVRASWSSGDMRRRPVTLALALISVFVAMATGFGKSADINGLANQLSIVRPVLVHRSNLSAERTQELDGRERQQLPDGVLAFERLPSTIHSQPWRLVTPIFLHFGIAHLLFNLLALMTFGSQIEMRRGAWFMLLLTLTVAIPSNVGEYYWSGPLFGGMSGVVYGMFGLIWMKSRYEPAAGFYMPPNGVLWMLGWLLLCMTGMMGSVANAAHLVGLVMGMAWGAAPSIYREILRELRLRKFRK